MVKADAARPKIKAIQTKYDGHRFRSRLEARWAVFFNEMGIKYEYETEGFSLPSGACYLPDFWLPELKCFMEVKPSVEVDYGHLYQILEFALDGKQDVYIATGPPCESQIVSVKFMAPTAEYLISNGFPKNPPDEDKASEIMRALLFYRRAEFGKIPGFSSWRIVWHEAFWKTNEDALEYIDLHRSLDRSKSARFEFGEKG